MIYNQKRTLLNYHESVPDLCESTSHLRFHIILLSYKLPQQLALKADPNSPIVVLLAPNNTKCLHKASGIIIFNLCDIILHNI